MEPSLKKSKSEIEVMQKLAENRKMENFQSLKQWDQNRAFHLMTHHKAAEQIEESLQNKIAQSNQFLRVVIKFLTDLQQQQKNYENQIVNSPEHKLRTNPVSKNIHMNTSKCLIRMYNLTQNYKPFRKVKALLEEGIKSIIAMQSQSERDIMEIRTKLELAIVQTQNANTDTSAKCDAVVAAYKQKGTKLFQVQTADLFILQQQFLEEAEKQTSIQCQYGKLTAQFLEIVEDLEKKKLLLIKQTLQKYLQALMEARENNESVKSLIDILKKKTEQQYIDILYSSQELLSKELIQDILKVLHKKQSENIDIQFVKDFLRNLKFVKFDNRNLILKQYRSYLKHEQDSTIPVNTQIQDQRSSITLENIQVLISVDTYLHLYLSQEEPEETQFGQIMTPNLSINLLNQNNFEIFREGDMAIRVGIRKGAIAGLARLAFNFGIHGNNNTNSSKKSYMDYILIVFMNEDQREEFMQFVQKITAK